MLMQFRTYQQRLFGDHLVRRSLRLEDRWVVLELIMNGLLVRHGDVWYSELELFKLDCVERLTMDRLNAQCKSEKASLGAAC